MQRTHDLSRSLERLIVALRGALEHVSRMMALPRRLLQPTALIS